MKFPFISLSFRYLCTFLFLFGCAVQTPPTGGPKDELPPVLLNSIPENRQTNFKGQEVELTFNEWVQTADFTNQLLITPTYRGSFKADVRKTIVTIEFDSAFDENTTYTLNFRDGIVDVTERNAPNELRIAFSTGDKLDSLGISGTVTDHLKNQPVDKYIVALFDVKDSLFVTYDVPKYFTKTNSSGRYRFENIKNGEYYVYAYNDINGDLKLQTSSEAIGFLESTIQLDSTIKDIDINTVFLNLDTLQLTSARQNGQYFEIKFNKSIDSVNLRPLNNLYLDSTFFLKPDNKSLRLFYSFPKTDTTKFELFASDSAGFFVRDTIDVSYSESRKDIDALTVGDKTGVINEDSTDLNVHVSLNKPIKYFNTDSLSLLINDSIIYDFRTDTSNNFTYQINNNELKLYNNFADTVFYPKDTTTNQFIIKNDKKIKAKITTKFKEGSLISVDGDSAKTFRINTKYFNEKQFGMIKGSVTSQYKTILQLLNPNYEVLKELKDPSQYVIDRLTPANYLLRLLIDTNGNGVWDPGNIYLNEQPEPVVFFENFDGSKEIILKANWEQIDINIQYPPVENEAESVGN